MNVITLIALFGMAWSQARLAIVAKTPTWQAFHIVLAIAALIVWGLWIWKMRDERRPR